MRIRETITFSIVLLALLLGGQTASACQGNCGSQQGVAPSVPTPNVPWNAINRDQIGNQSGGSSRFGIDTRSPGRTGRVSHRDFKACELCKLSAAKLASEQYQRCRSNPRYNRHILCKRIQTQWYNSAVSAKCRRHCSP